MNIVLTGFMASGKSTVGRQLSELLNRDLIDTDELIVEREGRSINDIFGKDGEEYFRRVESAVIVDAAKTDNTIISTGGGAVLNPKNMEMLRENGVIFNLDPDFSVIACRMEHAGAVRPLMRDQSLEDIRKRFDDRKPFYDNCDYKIHITADSSPRDTADKILNIINGLK